MTREPFPFSPGAFAVASLSEPRSSYISTRLCFLGVDVSTRAALDLIERLIGESGLCGGLNVPLALLAELMAALEEDAEFQDLFGEARSPCSLAMRVDLRGEYGS